MKEQNTFKNQLKKYKSLALILVLMIFYLVGIVGLTSTQLRPDFLPLSFLNLSISFLVLLIALKKHTVRLYVFMVLAFFIGMAAEWIGVHTGYLFGAYHYGENLGPLWWGVPIIIGINWVMLTIISASIAIRVPVHWIIKAFIGTVLMLGLDLLIEPVAIISDYWIWDGEIPISNFVGWFLIAFLIQVLYFSQHLAEQNKVATVLYCIQIVFFSVLNIVL